MERRKMRRLQAEREDALQGNQRMVKTFAAGFGHDPKKFDFEVPEDDALSENDQESEEIDEKNDRP
jgi:hypothetical protein